jgi:hypothetical protein
MEILKSKKERQPPLDKFLFSEKNTVFKPSAYDMYPLNSQTDGIVFEQRKTIGEADLLPKLAEDVMIHYATDRYAKRIAVLRSKENPNIFAIIFQNTFSDSADGMLLGTSKYDKTTDLFQYKKIKQLPDPIRLSKDGPWELEEKYLDELLEGTNSYVHRVTGGCNQIEIHKRNLFAGGLSKKIEYFYQPKVGYVLIETRRIEKKIAGLEKNKLGIDKASNRIGEEISDLKSRIVSTPKDLFGGSPKS